MKRLHFPLFEGYGGTVRTMPGRFHGRSGLEESPLRTDGTALSGSRSHSVCRQNQRGLGEEGASSCSVRVGFGGRLRTGGAGGPTGWAWARRVVPAGKDWCWEGWRAGRVWPFRRAGDYPESLRAIWRAAYVTTMSAPARRMARTASSRHASPSIHPRSWAARIAEYSPDTW